MLPLADFIGGGFGIIEKLIEVHKLDEWARLLLSLALSWFITTTGSIGAGLAANQPPMRALGLGLCAGATALSLLIAKDKRLKGIFVLPNNLPQPKDFNLEIDERK